MLQRQAYVVESIQQAVSAKRINLEAKFQAGAIGNQVVLQIGGDLVAGPDARPGKLAD